MFHKVLEQAAYDPSSGIAILEALKCSLQRAVMYHGELKPELVRDHVRSEISNFIRPEFEGCDGSIAPPLYGFLLCLFGAIEEQAESFAFETALEAIDDGIEQLSALDEYSGVEMNPLGGNVMSKERFEGLLSKDEFGDVLKAKLDLDAAQ